jgi:integrase
MKITPSRKSEWPKKVSFGRETVSIYRRKTPSGGTAYMVSNYSRVDQGSGKYKRRFDCYATEAEALEQASKLARQMSQRDVVSASITKDQAIDYASAVQALAGFNVSIAGTAATVADCLKLVGTLPNVMEAVRFYANRRKQSVRKRVPEVLAELLAIKESRGASARYLQDLRYRLNKFALSFQRDACNITTAEIQEWLDRAKLSAQGYTNFRRVLFLFFKFAVARNYASENPVVGVESVKVKGGDVKIFTPVEITQLLGAASAEFLPSLAVGAFAGLRSAEIERLDWGDVDLVGGYIIVGAAKAKTATRRVVPISGNLAEWLAPYSLRKGRLWRGTHEKFYDEQQKTAAAATIGQIKPVTWKSNGLRHSYASYRFALTADAGRVAGELGNTASVVHRHYRELVKPAEAQAWFSVRPDVPGHISQFSPSRERA